MNQSAGSPRLRAGFASEIGGRRRNEDFAALYLGTLEERARRGAVAVVADGIGGSLGGRVAAELAVRAFIEGYYGASPGLTPEAAAARALAAVNAWTHAMGQHDPELSHMGTTLSLVLFLDREAHIFHVGDSRVYLMRGGKLVRLTEDHNLHAEGYPNILERAVGIDEQIAADRAVHALVPSDRFFLCTDGIGGPLADDRIEDLLWGVADPEAAARALVRGALDAGGSDNATALIVDVTTLPGDMATATA